jgi:DNA-binding GntR family transcriptional regulator
MQILRPQLTLVEQVYEAILTQIESGRYGGDARLVQEEVAETLGVSRQPVRQALLLLRNEGVLMNAPGRGLMVVPLEAAKVRHLYEIRASLDALASRKAAERGSERARVEGAAFIERGRAAVSADSISEMIAADMAFHHFLYELSGNPMIAETASSHWSYLRCVMGAVLMIGQAPVEIWTHHEAIMRAVIDGDVAEAERLARRHINFSASTVLNNADHEVQMSH